MGGEDGAVDELGLLLGEDPFEAQQQRELAPPGGRGAGALGILLELREGHVQGAPAGRAGGEGLGGILALVQEALVDELLRPRDSGRTWDRRGPWGR